MNDKLIQALNNRYATKKFDSTKKIPQQDVDVLIEAIRLTPTSYGLQLMKVVLIEDKAIRQQLVGPSFGQDQVAEASHLLVLCREKNLDKNHIADYIQNIAETREIPTENLIGFENMMHKSILGMTAETQEHWLMRQVYIALGNLLTCCAILGIDACPMEGFKPESFDQILDLEAKNLTAVLLVPIGYRDAADKYATIKKVRRPLKDFLVKI